MKIGIMGTGYISEVAVAAIKRINNYEITSIYGHKRESIDRLLANTSIDVSGYTDKEMFIKSDVDIVYIATPNTHHFQDAKLALRNKKHVILEKPFVTTQNEAVELFKLARDNNVFIFEAIRTLYCDGFKVVKDNLHKIGKIRYSNFTKHQYSSRYDNYKRGEVTNIFSKDFFGGALNDLGVYVIHPAISFFGLPSEFIFSDVRLSNGVNGVFNITLNYEEGHLCNLSGSKICGIVESSSIHGEDGSIIINSITDFNRVELHDRSGNIEILYDGSDGFNESFYDEFKTMHEIIVTKNLEQYEKISSQTLQVMVILEEHNK